MKILTRYVLKEHVGPLMFALCALTSLLLLNYIAKQLPNLAGKGLPWRIVAEVLLLSVPFTVAMTLPMAVLVSTLYAFSKLTAENEIPAMKANGVSMASLLIPVAVCACVLAVAMVAFNDQFLPRTNHRLAALTQDIGQKKPTFALREHVLNDVLPNRGLTLSTDAIDRGRNRLHKVHIYDMTQPENIRTIHADSGDVALTLDQSDLILTLYDGYIVDVDRKNPSSLNRVYFTANRMKVEGVGNELRRLEQERVKGEREQSICEMDEKYQDAYRKQEVHKYNIRQRMIEVSRVAVNGDGEPFRQFDEPPVKAARTWGSSYCDGLKALARYIPGLETGTKAPLEESPDGAPADSMSAGMAPPTAEPAAAQAAASAMAAANPGIPPEQPDLDAYSAISNSYFSESVRTSIEETSFGLMMNQRQMDTFSVEIHKKFSLAAACVVFIILGVPFALRFARGGVGIVIGASLVIFAVSYVGLIAGEGLAKAGKLSPFVAMWGANFALAVIGGVLLLRMGRESIKKGNVFAALIDEIRERINLRRAGRR